jgi:hypothetical protein
MLHWHQGSSEESSSVTPSYPRQSSAAIITMASLTRRSGHPISSWYQISTVYSVSIHKSIPAIRFCFLSYLEKAKKY